MNDGPLQQLYDRLPELAGPVWWFADEQVSKTSQTSYTSDR